ncbi:MAG: DMT family transporter [Gemmatimonadaceae bacterium]
MATFIGRRYIAAMEPAKSSVSRATLLIIASALSFGSISVLTVLITRSGLPLITAMAWRYIVASGVLLGITGIRQLRRVASGKLVGLLIIGGSGQALITYLSLHALQYISVGPLAFLFYTYPAWVTLLAAIRGAERLTPVSVAALSLAMIGVTVIVGLRTTEKLNPIGVTLALASALLYSVYLPLLSHFQHRVPAFVATFLVALGAGISFVLVAAFGKQLYFPSAPAVWSNILILALVSTVIAFSTLIKGLSVLGPVRTSIIATVEPFFTAILGVAILGNALTITMLIGGVFIATAVLVIQWNSVRLGITGEQPVADVQPR